PQVAAQLQRGAEVGAGGGQERVRFAGEHAARVARAAAQRVRLGLRLRAEDLRQQRLGGVEVAGGERAVRELELGVRVVQGGLRNDRRLRHDLLLARL